MEKLIPAYGFYFPGSKIMLEPYIHNDMAEGLPNTDHTPETMAADVYDE